MTITLPGVRVGHHTDPAARTGCTVLLFPDGTVGSGEIRGGAPASREFALLDPQRAVNEVHAAVLTGGSAFGLACADGVMRYLEETGRGVRTVAGRVPIVPTLGLFDLMVGDPAVRPSAEDGYRAARAAAEFDAAEWRAVVGSDGTGAHLGTAPILNPEVNGMIGAGTGATVNKYRGPEHVRPGGLAYREARSGDLVVGALIAVNAFGGIDDGSLPDDASNFAPFTSPGPGQNTTIGVVITNAKLDKTGCLIVAQGAHDGLARAITPPHTRYDGDAFISAATGQVEAEVDHVRMLAMRAVVEAIRSRA